MAIVVRKLINSLDLSTYETFLRGLDSTLLDISTTSDTITCGVDSSTYGFTLDNLTSGFVTFSYYDNGVKDSNKYAQIASPAEITVAYNNDFFYIQVQTYSASNHRFIFIYDNINNIKFYGSIGSQTSTSTIAFYDITTVPMLNLSDNNEYNFGNRISYRATNDNIDYIESTPLVISGAEAYSDNKLYNCTYLNYPNTIITFSQKNYYAIGNNILIPMDS